MINMRKSNIATYQTSIFEKKPADHHTEENSLEKKPADHHTEENSLEKKP